MGGFLSSICMTGDKWYLASIREISSEVEFRVKHIGDDESMYALEIQCKNTLVDFNERYPLWDALAMDQYMATQGLFVRLYVLDSGHVGVYMGDPANFHNYLYPQGGLQSAPFPKRRNE